MAGLVHAAVRFDLAESFGHLLPVDFTEALDRLGDALTG